MARDQVLSMNDEAQNKMCSVPTGPRHWVRSKHLSLISCRGARSRHGEQNWPDKRGSGAVNSLNKEQAWPTPLRRWLNISTTQAAMVL